MDIITLIIALVAGIAAAMAGGALSGMKIGAGALGADLAAYMGVLYCFLAGSIGVVAGLVVLGIMQGGL